MAGRPKGSINRLSRDAFKALEAAAGPRLSDLYNEMITIALDRSVSVKTRVALLIHLDQRFLGRPAQQVEFSVTDGADKKAAALAALDELLREEQASHADEPPAGRQPHRWPQQDDEERYDDKS